MTRLVCVVTALLCCVGMAHAGQAIDTALVEQAARKAVGLMDRNLPQEAIRSWDEAIELRKDYAPYKYERSICLMMLKKYEDAANALEEIYTLPDVYDRGYQLLGNCYDFMGDTTKAHRCYRDGIKAWPKSGRLHFELGNVAYLDKDKQGALTWWANGANAEPEFATNYYQICVTFANSPYRFWAALYGEVFLNIERATERTKEVSALLFNIWNESIKPGTDDPVNLASDELLNEPSPLGASVMNFPTAFEFTVGASVLGAKVKGPVSQLSVAQVVRIRTHFAKIWKESGYLQKYPNDLLTFHVTMLDAGWLSEYFWWLYSYGDTKQMNEYYRENEQRYDTFLGRFGEHKLDVLHPVCLGFHCQ